MKEFSPTPEQQKESFHMQTGCELLDRELETFEDHEFSKTIEKSALFALKHIEQQYDNENLPHDERLDYHNAQHTHDVVERTVKILSICEQEMDDVSKRDILIGALAAAFHDTVQEQTEESGVVEVAPHEYQNEEHTFTKRMRRREIGGNERASAEKLITLMRSVNEYADHDLFSVDDEERVMEAIMVTEPTFSDEKGIFQGNLKEETSVVARAVAFADLNDIGIENPEKSWAAVTAIFREENMDMHDAIRRLPSMSDAEKDYHRVRVKKFLVRQRGFKKNREDHVRREISALPPTVQKRLWDEVFTEFANYTDLFESNAGDIEGQDLETQLANLGYAV